MDLPQIKAEAARISDGVVPTDDAVRLLARLVALLIEKLESQTK